ncbi:MAG TPA: AraC family transcriptional regulator [Candidatus Margulisiibacteriota bacterium]|nr:AraC family transcriptional regulator [Candidatus Margulisiibacteriota bacterium]
MEVLSDVLRVVRLTGAVFFSAEFSSPWALESPNSDLLASVVMPEAECVVLFHILTEGECIVTCQAHPPVKMEAGDVIIFPHGNAHTMRSHDGAKLTPIRSVFSQASPDALPQVAFGGGGKKARFLCGYLNCNQRFNPLIGALPTMLLVRSRDDYAAVEAIDGNGARPAEVPQDSGTWLSTTLKFTINEAKAARPGNAAMLGRLTELMFVEILRQYMQQLPADHGGWLAGLNDAHVGKALRLMHANPAQNWTVTELAREAGMCRSALAERFTQLVGESPMRYLAGWRIQLAMQMLRDGASGIAEVAARVGYESEAAFNRAFKRAVGSPPAAWRKIAFSVLVSTSVLLMEGEFWLSLAGAGC